MYAVHFVLCNVLNIFKMSRVNIIQFLHKFLGFDFYSENSILTTGYLFMCDLTFIWYS